MAKSTSSRNRAMRWSAWLGLGVVASVGIGFAYGLTKPRARAA